jgi:hypothetical protein
MRFSEKKLSVKSAAIVLAKNKIQVNISEATTILDLLYLIAKSYKKTDGSR